MKLLRRLLIFSHRYLGIAISALVVMWFATGITMMYVGGMPRLTPELRLERMTAVGLADVRLTPAEAAERAEFGRPPSRATLLSILGRPAYRFGGNGGTTIVYADTGEVADEFTQAQTRDIAARFMRVPVPEVDFRGTIDEPDQWTLGMSGALPLHKFAIADGAGSELYISPITGDAAMLTTSRTRAYAWVSTIPHFLYFTSLRNNQPLWYRIVIWTSGLAAALAVVGLVLGVVLWRRGRATISAAIPYSGWMRWHYVTGLVFGVFSVTWAFSGLVSMEPWAWTNQRGIELRASALTGGPLQLAAFRPMETGAWTGLLEGAALKEVDFVRMQGEHYYVARRTFDEGRDLGKRERIHQPYQVGGRTDPQRLIVSAATLERRVEPFTPEQVVARVKMTVPDAPVARFDLLTDYDSYYYSRRAQTPLPVVRIQFADPAQTWLYIDPVLNQPLASIPKYARLERWLYNGLHSLDFGYLYQRPLWDIVMLVLLAGGLMSSSIGLYLGFKRVVRAVAGSVPHQAGVGDMPAPGISRRARI
jgi:uncharacterized iron-regulated membrane protein